MVFTDVRLLKAALFPKSETNGRLDKPAEMPVRFRHLIFNINVESKAKPKGEGKPWPIIRLQRTNFSYSP